MTHKCRDFAKKKKKQCCCYQSSETNFPRAPLLPVILLTSKESLCWHSSQQTFSIEVELHQLRFSDRLQQDTMWKFHDFAITQILREINSSYFQFYHLHLAYVQSLMQLSLLKLQTYPPQCRLYILIKSLQCHFDLISRKIQLRGKF